MNFFASFSKLYTTTVLVFISISHFKLYSCTEEMKLNSSGCEFRNYSDVLCTGDFNLSLLLQAQAAKDSTRQFSEFYMNMLGGLQIINTSLTQLNPERLQFHGYTFDSIYIQNALNLNDIASNTFLDLKNSLRDFRAINTSLPQYNPDSGITLFPTPFDELYIVNEVYVGPQPSCPNNIELLSGGACKCEAGHLWRKVPSGLHGYVASQVSNLGYNTHLTCASDVLSGEDLKSFFERISSTKDEPKHFDVVTIRGKNITRLPSRMFSLVSITTLWMEGTPNLSSIHRHAFSTNLKVVGLVGQRSVANSIQVLSIVGGNFSGVSDKQVSDFFSAISSLRNIRHLRLDKLGLPYIPAYAFLPPTDGAPLRNLRHLSISFDRQSKKLDGKGISRIGSYAFYGAPRLYKLGLIKNSIEKFDSFAFASKEASSIPLTVEIGGNPFNDSVGLAPNAFSGSQRPLHIKFEIDSFAASDPANDPNFQYFPRNVFEPFIAENPNNTFEIDYYNVEIWCDCGTVWMFDSSGILKPQVVRALKIKRVQDNVVSSDYSSVQCKVQSSFECFSSPCLIFKDARLIHCSGATNYDVAEQFKQLEQKLGFELYRYTKLQFSSSGIHELQEEAFGRFQFKQIYIQNARNLSLIHPRAFGASSFYVDHLSINNTNLKTYPNFGLFPNLVRLELDDVKPFYLNRSNFDFSNQQYNSNSSNDDEMTTSSPQDNESASTQAQALVISMDNGVIDPATFTNVSFGGKSITLNIGARVDCSTMACLFQCSPTKLKLTESVFKPFLDLNPTNKLYTACHVNCDCELKWLYNSWDKYQGQVEFWISEYTGRKFNCVDPKDSKKEEEELGGEGVKGFFGFDLPKFNNGSYFDQNKC